MEQTYTIKEVASMYKVTPMAVRHWIKTHSIPFDTERVIGVKPRIVVRIEDVKKALNLK